MPSCARRRRAPRSSACRCCAGASSRRTASRPRTSKPKPDAAWVLQSDRGITYTAEVPVGSRLVGRRMVGPDYSGPPLVSFEKKIAEGLGLKIGDDITVNVLGRNITARIANLRTVDWQSLGINFVLVFSPGAFAGAPVTDIATLTFPGGGTAAEETALMKAVTERFPASPRCGSRRRSTPSAPSSTNLVLGDARGERDHADRGRPGARRGARGRASPSRLRCRHPQDARRDAAPAHDAPTRSNTCCSGCATVVFGVAAGSIAGWGDRRRLHGAAVPLAGRARDSRPPSSRSSSRSCSAWPAPGRRSAAKPAAGVAQPVRTRDNHAGALLKPASIRRSVSQPSLAIR